MATLEEKVENSRQAVSQLITLLDRCGEQNWASKFVPVQDHLENWDLDQAIAAYGRIPMPNMGGFLDLILCELNGHSVRDEHQDNELLQQARGALSKSLKNLEVYMKHEIDHPLVVIPNCA